MEEFGDKGRIVKRLEFWAATGILVLVTLSVLEEYGKESPGGLSFFSEPLFGFAARAAALYLAFLFWNFYIVPKLLRKEAIVVNILLLGVTCAILGLVFYNPDMLFIPPLLFAAYYTFKYMVMKLWIYSQTLQSKYKFMAPGALLAFCLWIISMVFFLIGDAERGVISVWGILIPFGILLYSYSFYSLIPESLVKRKPFRAYLWKVVLVLILTEFPLIVLAFLMTADEEAPMAISSVNALFQLIITVPLSWFFYKRYTQGTEEISTLKKELGQSVASIDFLRSQINPHFLFNALNTLYGTALLEKAERTSEGIQKLGDMMRFMLQENTREKISLNREIEYLNNYISLQKLRTDSIATIQIMVDIEQPSAIFQISPMLLIPFVENAFKHGISLREPSHIKIALTLKDNVLYFDVDNSRHEKAEHDPEKSNNGIGLNNVKQRLALLYPDKHELTIRETGRFFFIHLTIHLS
jgi:two-component system LytT family sensor kinase